MLYTHDQSYDSLLALLEKAGVEADVIRIAETYLDLSQPRNDALLEQIPTREVTMRTYSDVREFDTQVEKRIKKHRDPELTERWILLIHAIGGSSAATQLGLFSFRTKGEDCPVLHAFASRFGNRGEAVLTALYAEQAASHRYAWKQYPPRTAEAACQALPFVTSSIPDAKLLLCIYGLDQLPLPEQQGLAAGLVQGVEDVYKTFKSVKHTADSAALMLIALALAGGCSDHCRSLFTAEVGKSAKNLAELLPRLAIQPAKLLDAIEACPEAVTIAYIQYIAACHAQTDAPLRDVIPGLQQDGRLERLATAHAKDFRYAMGQCETPSIAKLMLDAYKTVYPDYVEQPDSSLQYKAQMRTIGLLSELYPNQKAEILHYLKGETGLDTLLSLRDQFTRPNSYWGGKWMDYATTYGMDDFAQRCVCFNAIISPESDGLLRRCIGVSVPGNERLLMGVLKKHKLPAPLILDWCGGVADSYYDAVRTEAMDKFAQELVEIMDQIVGHVTLKTHTVTGRIIYLWMLTSSPVHAQQYKAEILQMAEDSSKAVRTELQNYLKKHPEWDADIVAMLKAKKIAQREMAIELLAAFGVDKYRTSLMQAMEQEKKEELQQRMAVLLGESAAAAADGEQTLSIPDMVKGNKSKKVAWLFEVPFSPVRLRSGEPADISYLQALLLCYANMTQFAPSATAATIAEMLLPEDLTAFMLEVFGKWVDAGAAAKQKWVLYCCAIHGNTELLDSFKHYIKEWAEHSRSAIAAEAVRAMALNGSAYALMTVDNMARKFKNAQVKRAASEALTQAAQVLGITTEELADRIVPDLGFDAEMCRTFDYGTRQFRVFLTPALELEIFEGEKKLKNLPKPGVKDDAEQAEAAAKAFKEMKKQLKGVVTAQKQRLEYVLLCERTWNWEGWKALFVQNPVMHSFAIGLIWGTYQDGKLQETFRYMEDGSFTTADEDEFTPEETAQIGLVHPIELSEETLAAWQEQLSDYEITQPFLQLSRPIYRVTEAETEQIDLLRFVGKTMTGYTLASRMNKYQWEKGTAMDGGFFYDYFRRDIIGFDTNAKGQRIPRGMAVTLTFSGMYIATGAYGGEDEVTIGKIRFYPAAGKMRLDYHDESAKDADALPLGKVSPRYFSEILAQLTASFGNPDAETTE